MCSWYLYLIKNDTEICLEYSDITLNRVFAWGRNAYGELGLGFLSKEPIPTPQEIGSLRGKKVISMSAGVDFSVVVCENPDTDEILTFGRGDVGQLNGVACVDIHKPQLLFGMPHFGRERISKVDSGWGHSVILTSTSLEASIYPNFLQNQESYSAGVVTNTHNVVKAKNQKSQVLCQSLSIQAPSL